MEETGLNLMPKWALCGDYEDTRRLKDKLGDKAAIYDWTQTCKDAIEADIAYGYFVGVNDLKRRFGVAGQWLDYPPLRCQVYYAHWGRELFNSKYFMMPLGEIPRKLFNEELPTEFFMRPDSNNKGFTGMIFNKKEVDLLLTNSIVGPETLVVTAPAKDMSLAIEYRCFMRAGKYITGSSYQLLEDGTVSSYNCDWDGDLINYVENNFPPYKDLPELYALDIVLDTEWGMSAYSLMELTCWSCAGLYDIDLDKYIRVTEEAWEARLKEYE